MKGGAVVWLIVVVGVLGAAAAFFLKVLPEHRRLSSALGELEAARIRLVTAAGGGVIGGAALTARRTAADDLDDAAKKAAIWYRAEERSVFPGWFPEVGSGAVRPEDLRRVFGRRRDDLMQFVRDRLAPLGVKDPPHAWHEIPWLRGGDPPADEQARATQDRCWIEDAFMRTLALKGAWLREPPDVEETWRPRPGGDPFEERRVLAKLLSVPARATAAVEALLSRIARAPGDGDEGRLLALVDRVLIAREAPAGGAAEGAGEPPVKIDMTLTLVRLRTGLGEAP